MENAREEFFAGAGFPLKQNRDLRIFCDITDLGQQLPHGRAVSLQIRQRILAVLVLPFVFHTPAKSQKFQSPVHHRVDAFEIDGLD